MAPTPPDYKVWDLVNTTPYLTEKATDQSGRKWDAAGETGLEFHPTGPLNVEYWRDVRPILERSCVACHTKTWDQPAGGLVLDDDRDEIKPLQLVEGDEAPHIPAPATYRRLVSRRGQESFYMQRFQSRQSYFVWSSTNKDEVMVLPAFAFRAYKEKPDYLKR